jgi:hypothetical protein
MVDTGMKAHLAIDIAEHAQLHLFHSDFLCDLCGKKDF